MKSIHHHHISCPPVLLCIYRIPLPCSLPDPCPPNSPSSPSPSHNPAAILTSLGNKTRYPKSSHVLNRYVYWRYIRTYGILYTLTIKHNLAYSIEISKNIPNMAEYLHTLKTQSKITCYTDIHLNEEIGIC